MSRIVLSGFLNGIPKPFLFEQSSQIIEINDMEIQEIDLRYISQLTDLRILDLSMNKIEQLDLKPLARCFNLTHVNLSNNRITSIDLQPLARCKNLTWLSLTLNQLREIDLTPLRKCRDLRYLFLAGNQFKEIAIDPLQKCTNLREIVLTRKGDPGFKKAEEALDIRPLLQLRKLKKFQLSKNHYVTLGLTESTHKRKPRGISDCIKRSKFVGVSDIVQHYIKKMSLVKGIKKIEDDIEKLNASYWYTVRRNLFEEFGLDIVAGYDGSIADLIPENATIDDKDWIDSTIANVAEEIEKGASTVLFDIDEFSMKLPSHGKLRAAILESRTNEIKNANIYVCEKCVDLREVWYTAWGFQLLKEEGFWIFGTSGKQLIEIRNRLRELGFGLTFKSIRIRDPWPTPRNEPKLKVRQAILGFVDTQATPKMMNQAMQCINKSSLHPLRGVIETIMTELYGEGDSYS